MASPSKSCQIRPSQIPTATGVRVRSTHDANVLFHAVFCGILPMVTRRLDAADRAALRSGCVYIWEERSPAADATGVGMERFTEGRHWHPSRVRDDFLLYVEKDWDTTEAQAAERNRLLRHHRESFPSSSYPIQLPRRQPLVKQTYSAWVNTGGSLKKWHMNAYYTEDTLDSLRTVDDVPPLANLKVPHECYQRARSGAASTSKKSGANGTKDIFPAESTRAHASRRNSTTSQNSMSDRDQVSQVQAHVLPPHIHPMHIHVDSPWDQARLASFPPSPSTYPNPPPTASSSGSHGDSPLPRLPSATRSCLSPLSVSSITPTSRPNSHFPPLSPSPSPSITSSQFSSSIPSPATPDGTQMLPLYLSPVDSNPMGLGSRSLVPLDRLRSGQQILRREPADDEMLRSFRPL